MPDTDGLRLHSLTAMDNNTTMHRLTTFRTCFGKIKTKKRWHLKSLIFPKLWHYSVLFRKSSFFGCPVTLAVSIIQKSYESPSWKETSMHKLLRIFTTEESVSVYLFVCAVHVFLCTMTHPNQFWFTSCTTGLRIPAEHWRQTDTTEKQTSQ